MEKQVDLFGSEIGQSFKSDQLSKEELQFKVASLEKEIFRLKSQNSKLYKQVDQVVQAKLASEEISIEEVSLPQNLNSQDFKANPISWGARYKSRNPEVSDLVIPDEVEPDHIYSEDRLNYILEQACACEDCRLENRIALQALDDLVTRKLILTRERRMSFVCSQCSEKGIQKLIEKHLEAELYCNEV